MNEKFILGSKIMDITLQDALRQVEQFLREPRVHYGVTPNSEICLMGYRDQKLREITKHADLSLPDSFGLKIGGFILKQEINNIVPGVDFTNELLALAGKKKYRVTLIGGRGKSGIKAIENIKLKYPGIEVEYIHGGEFTDKGVSEYPDFIQRLNDSHADIVFVNLGAPKQEYFIYNHRDQLNCKFIIGVGGTIDFLAGNLQRAPQWMNRIGLEWLYRLIQEPSRYKRIINAVFVFPIKCITWKLRTMFLYRKGTVGMIINNENKILIAKRMPRVGDRHLTDHWQLPQGGMDRGETAQQGVIREMHEELGISSLEVIDECPEPYQYTWSFMPRLYYPFKGQKQRIFLLRFTGDDSEFNLDRNELSEYRWVDKLHISQLVHEHRKPVVALALKYFDKYF